MLLYRIRLNPRIREARRDLSDPYQMHATLCRAFSAPDRRCPAGEFLWRLEPETDSGELPCVLIQSRGEANWSAINVPGWLASGDPAIDLREKLRLDALTPGRRFRFRLRANPCKTQHGKRMGLIGRPDQETWLARMGEMHGFALPTLAAVARADACASRIDVSVTQEQMLRGRQHGGNGIRVYGVLYDGILSVTDPGAFTKAIADGIGHGKSLGLGLLSVAPIS